MTTAVRSVRKKNRLFIVFVFANLIFVLLDLVATAFDLYIADRLCIARRADRQRVSRDLVGVGNTVFYLVKLAGDRDVIIVYLVVS